jgi:glycosyltransferase involved in cell wall biosynthesis
MKILLVSGIYPPDVGGPASYIPKLADAMNNQGIRVEVLTLRNRQTINQSPIWKVNYVNREGALLFRMIKVICITLTKLRKSEAVFANGLHQEIAIALCFNRVRSVAKIVGDPVWERARNKGETTLTLPEFTYAAKKTARQQVERIFLAWSLNRYDLVICPSVELVEIVRTWGVKTKIQFIPNGVNELTPSQLEKKYDICSASRLVKWKNINKVIKAADLAKASVAIAGEGPELPKLEKEAINNQKPVHFVGQLSDLEVNKLLNQSKLFVLFSDYEGLSFGLLKAMSLGMPIIVSDAPGNTAVLQNRKECLVVPRGDIEMLSEAISELLNDPILAKRLGENAKQRATTHYSEEHLINQVIAILKSRD